MSDASVEISGQNSKTFYEFLCDHNIANDGMRLGQRFVSLYIKQPWPELFYEQSDRVAMARIQDWLEEHHFYPKMPQPLGK